MKKTKIISISIDKELYERIKTLYMEFDLNCSRSKFISDLLLESVEEYEGIHELLNTKPDGGG